MVTSRITTVSALLSLLLAAAGEAVALKESGGQLRIYVREGMSPQDARKLIRSSPSPGRRP